MARWTAVAVVALAMLAMAHARMPRSKDDMAKMVADAEKLRENRRADSHEFFVLVKREGKQENTMENTEELVKDFKQRLGQDKNVKMSAVSKDKIYIHLKGDRKFADEMISAVRSFPEAQFVERKPEYKTRERVGGRGTRRDRSGMRQRIPSGQEAPSATM